MLRSLSIVVLTLVANVLTTVPAIAADAADDEVTALREEIAELRRDTEARIAALERRLAELEGTPPAEDDALARLRAAGRAAAREAAPAAATPAPEPGRRRSLNALNPEISYTLNVLAVASDSAREEFVPQEFELDLQAALDPFSKSRVTLAVGEEGEVEIEEGYIVYSGLPGSLQLLAGRFRQTFGVLNRQHLHALPQSEYPPALTAFFGDEGLRQTGVSLVWLLPRGWATANELTVQLTDGGNEAFGGEDFERLAGLFHLKSFWELSDAAWFEWGLSGAGGETPGGGSSRVWGSDLTWHWQPPARAKEREITWRSEVLYSERDDPLGRRRHAWAGYAYLEGLLRRNLFLGLRYDRVEDPLYPAHRRRGFVPYLSFWQSEFVRLRAELQRLEDELSGDTENRFVFQLTWAAGPHKHQTY